MIERLFVYGTLAPGRPNEHVLAGLAGIWEPATVQGRLVHDGWGSAMGYPAIVLDDAGEPVDGFLFSSPALGAHWARLDDFEGDGIRARGRARAASGWFSGGRPRLRPRTQSGARGRRLGQLGRTGHSSSAVPPV